MILLIKGVKILYKEVKVNLTYITVDYIIFE